MHGKNLRISLQSTFMPVLLCTKHATSYVQLHYALTEEEAETASSAAIRASRAREKMDRDAREKEKVMTQALRDKEAQVAELLRKCEILEGNHARDLQVWQSLLVECAIQLP